MRSAFSLDSELVPEMENAKADTNASGMQARAEVNSTLLRLDTASLPSWNSRGRGKNEVRHWHISLFEAGLETRQQVLPEPFRRKTNTKTF